MTCMIFNTQPRITQKVLNSESNQKTNSAFQEQQIKQ